MKKIFLYLAAIAILAPLNSFASGSSLVLCSKGTKIQAKAKCARGEHTVSLGALKTAGASNCVLHSVDIAGAAAISGTATCSANETFVSHGGFLNGDNGQVSSIELRVLVDSNLVGGVTYSFIDPKGGAMDATVQAWCCS